MASSSDVAVLDRSPFSGQQNLGRILVLPLGPVFLSSLMMICLTWASPTWAQSDSRQPLPSSDAGNNEVASRYDVASPRSGNWGVSAFALSAVSRRMVNEGGASLFTYAYPALNYRLGPGRRVSFRPVVLIDFAGRTNRGAEIPTQGRMGDVELAHSDFEMIEFDDYTSFGGSTKFGFPTSDSSQERGIYGRVSGRYLLTRSLSPRLQVAYVMEPELILNSRNSTQFGRRRSNNRLAEYAHSIEVTYDATRRWAPMFNVGYKHTWLQADPGIDRPRLNDDYFRWGFGTWFEPSFKLRFLAKIDNEINLRSRNGVGYLRDVDDETQFVLLTFASIL